MNLKGKARQICERLTGTHIFRTLPKGVDLASDLRTFVPRTRIRTIFDVGANLGQSAEYYLRNFPGARLHCFEPSQATFLQLKAQLKGRAQLHRIALGATAGTGQISTGDDSDMRSLLESGGPTEQVSIQRLDDFCQDAGIEQIDLLKIDTEGYDLEVLKGGERLLTSANAALVQVEAGMHPDNERHVPFEKLKSHLERRGYRLFAFYEQVEEWTLGAPHLRRTNPVFVSSRVIAANLQ